MQFKFSFVRGDNAASVFGKEGQVFPEGLLLDGKQLAMQAVADTDTRGKRVVITLAPGAYLDPGIAEFADEGCLVLDVRSPAARQVEIAIDVIASHAEARQHYAALEAQGRADAYRVLPCPTCGATIDLSDVAHTEYHYCRFCNTIHHHSGQLAHSDAYRICDECDMFDRNQAYTELYFYFLLVIWGASYSSRNMCDNCARGLFWKAFLINFIFVLGVPSAIWIRIKASMGRDPALAGLAAANALALKGKSGEAQQAFATMLQTLPNHPGLHTNEARGYVANNDRASAERLLQMALQVCPNYVPATKLLTELHAPPSLPAG
jgi:Zn-finger nucleic acid-binding protein